MGKYFGFKGKSFQEIIGHEDIKKIFNNAIISKKPVHILLVGSPGSVKTMFLIEIGRAYDIFIINWKQTSKAGVINQLSKLDPGSY